MTDPGRRGGEGTGQTGWHRHANGHVVPDAECADTEHIEGIYGPLETRIVFDPVTARDTIARALGEHEGFGGGFYCSCTPVDENDSHEPIEERTWEDHLAAAILAALASQERGE